jgi:hypothetical protein
MTVPEGWSPVPKTLLQWHPRSEVTIEDLIQKLGLLGSSSTAEHWHAGRPGTLLRRSPDCSGFAMVWALKRDNWTVVRRR